MSFFASVGQDLDSANKKVVADFIYCIKNQKKDKLISNISFPFERSYPIPQIKNKQEFLKRYKEVFDDTLSKMIINSDINNDWSAVGWRGIMLMNGVLWIDYDGRLIAVNYESPVESKMRTELIEKDRSNLYSSIKKFAEPIHILETSKYRIRIDDMGNGNYRYVSWPLKSKMSDPPDIIIENGEYIADGSGGNHNYEFKNKEYTYECYIIVMGEENSPPAELTISKNGKEILSQKARIITK